MRPRLQLKGGKKLGLVGWVELKAIPIILQQDIGQAPPAEWNRYCRMGGLSQPYELCWLINILPVEKENSMLPGLTC